MTGIVIRRRIEGSSDQRIIRAMVTETAGTVPARGARLETAGLLVRATVHRTKRGSGDGHEQPRMRDDLGRHVLTATQASHDQVIGVVLVQSGAVATHPSTAVAAGHSDLPVRGAV